MAAEVLAVVGLQVTIVDHQVKPARKFLLAGRGGLNITHSEPLDLFLSRYGEARERLAPAISDFGPEALREWCNGLGIETFVGTSGRVFPVGMKASQLLRAWLRRLDGLGVKLESQTAWQGFDDVPTVLAMGGASWPELGSDGRWVREFEKAGVIVSPLWPSNGRLRVAWPHEFSAKHAGQPIKNVAVRFGEKSQRGEVMISSDGIEGGAIYAVGHGGSGELVIDLKPDLSPDHVAARVAKRRPKDSRSSFLRKAFNLSPAAIGLMRAMGSEDPKCVVVPIMGQGDLRRAISTRGGVAFSEVDAHFKLRKVRNTWVVGEMLDWDAPTGGYLLQACFSTARWAAQDVVREMRATRLHLS